jgi:hypothetical protein
VTTRIVAACAAVLILAGCSGSEPSSTPPPTAPPPPPSQIEVTTDPCTLLSEADASAHVGVPVKAAVDDLPNVGRGCRWEAPGGEAYVSLNLNTPKFPDLSSAQRTLDIGAKKGTVLSDDGLYCLVYVDNGTPWLQFSSQSAQAGAPDPAPKTYECDRSVPVLQKVITSLKW